MRYAALALTLSVLLAACRGSGTPLPVTQSSAPTIATTHDGTIAPPDEAELTVTEQLTPTDTTWLTEAGPGPLPLLDAPANLTARSPDKIAGVTAEAYMVMDWNTGEILLETSATTPLPPASLTKIMTAVLALERGNLDDLVTVDESVLTLHRYSTLMGIKPGERLTLRDLLYGLMLPSGNDAAIAIARHLAGNETTFVEWMNQRARELGLASAHYANPHGLDSRRTSQVLSAYDLAELTRYAMLDPEFRDIVGTRLWTAHGEQQTYGMANSNRLLGAYSGAEGVKIGYTRRAGQTLVGSVVRDGRRLIVVVLGSQQRVTDTIRLLDAAFALP